MINWVDLVTSFYARVQADGRVSPTHISLYFALLHEARNAPGFPFYLQKGRVMRLAKICSPVTVNKCLRELHEYGYIIYKPNFKPGHSMVELPSISNPSASTTT
jgi:hypothetical protein